MKKKRKVTPEEIRRLMGEEWYDRHERTQRLLAERIAFHRVKLAEERGEQLDPDEVVRELLASDPNLAV
jgi:hypothetical protein